MAKATMLKEQGIDATLYQVGDLVDVKADHNDENGNRVNDWMSGTVVQADRKMVAVQFTQDVYLTDGWMVPDRVLWLQQSSQNIRGTKKSRSKKR
jgi:hypothetical protein